MPVVRHFLHAWERRLANVDTNRRVRPFEWGLDWLGLDRSADPRRDVVAWSTQAVAESPSFFTATATADYDYDGEWLRFPSAVVTPNAVNNTVVARVFHPAEHRRGARRRAVLVLPQWNADAEGHVGLCRLFARFGLTAVRLTLPYHDLRKPADLERADYIVSPNVGRTAQINRQAVLDARRAIDWLTARGYERIGLMGTSLGSCLSMLTMAHDPRVAAGAFNHISPYFADVVWRGLSTRHVRAGLDGHIDLDTLRDCWMPISPFPYIERVRERPVLLVYARYDLSFPVDLSRAFVEEFRRRRVAHATTVLPCGHYTTGKAPFKYLDGYALTKFFVKRL
ncbi:MAG: abhydrolase domain-containing 18 [Acidobacteria bacterium]|nr:abhydrolase domain-containing 18 [Acidobacteriota bacterium]